MIYTDLLGTASQRPGTDWEAPEWRTSSCPWHHSCTSAPVARCPGSSWRTPHARYVAEASPRDCPTHLLSATFTMTIVLSQCECTEREYNSFLPAGSETESKRTWCYSCKLSLASSHAFPHKMESVRTPTILYPANYSDGQRNIFEAQKWGPREWGGERKRACNSRRGNDGSRRVVMNFSMHFVNFSSKYGSGRTKPVRMYSRELLACWNIWFSLSPWTATTSVGGNWPVYSSAYMFWNVHKKEINEERVHLKK